MDAAERGRSREERLFKALSGEMAELQSELGTAEQPRRLGLRLEIQACEMLLGNSSEYSPRPQWRALKCRKNRVDVEPRAKNPRRVYGGK